jgi:amino acid transporter
MSVTPMQTTQTPIASKEGLLRGIGRWDLVAIAINGIIGAGIFGLPSKVFALIGSYSLIAFVACALVVTLIILCFAEVSSRFEETGGPYLYAREAFGPTVAFEVGWLIWLARLTAFAANCNLMVIYLSFFWPPADSTVPRAIIIVLVVVSLASINIIGVRQAAIASNFFTIGKLIPLLAFIAVGLFFLNPQPLTLGPAPSAGPFSQSVLLLIYAFTGFEMAAIPAGEIRDPRRHLPMALMVAIAVVALIYILVQLVCIGTLPGLAISKFPLADAADRLLPPLLRWQTWLGIVITISGGAIVSAGAIISIVGNLNIILLSGSRVPFAIAEQSQLPAFLAKVHRRFLTPHIAIVITAAVMMLLTLKSSFVAALTISAIARLVTYAVTCAALPVLRRKASVPAAIFKVRGGPIIAVAALLLAVWLLLNSTQYEAMVATIAGEVGLVIYVTVSTQGRLNRAKYFLRLLAIAVLTQIVVFAAGVFLRMIMGRSADQVAPLITAVISLAGTVLSASQVVKRLHDLDKPGSHYWLLLVPLYNIYLMLVLLFKKGTEASNQYGENPLAQHSTTN